MASASTPPPASPPPPPASAPASAAGELPPQGPLDFLWRVAKLLGQGSGCMWVYVFLIWFFVLGTNTSGCSDVKLKNYNKVNVGMSLQEVEAVLGTGQPLAIEDVPPDLDKGIVKPGQTTKARIWSSGSSVIVLLFQGDKVVAKLSKGL